jgi:pimeloyl-ACP methyl ester carboxylesterase
VLFLPTWSVIHSRCWKAQVPHFACHFRVLVFDPRGNGRSDRPSQPSAYAESEFARDALDVMDASGTERAVLVCLSRGARRALLLGAEHPERVLGVAFIGPSVAIAPRHPVREEAHRRFLEERGPDSDQGWARWNASSWRRDYRGFLEFFFARAFTEPHSTKQIEDCVGWGLETDPDTLIAAELPGGVDTREEALGLCRRLRCPVLVVHGEEDAVVPIRIGEELAAATGGKLLRLPGCGHIPSARKPVLVNGALQEFVELVARAPPEYARLAPVSPAKGESA